MGENVARVREVVARLLASRPAWPVPAEVAEARELLSPDRGPLAELELAEGRAASWEAEAAQMARNRDFYRGLVDEVAGQLGPEAYEADEADDGVVHEDPVRAKVPILVARLVDEVERERASAALRVGVEALLRGWRVAETLDRQLGGVAGEVGATARADCVRGAEALLARVPERSPDVVECHAHERDVREIEHLRSALDERSEHAESADAEVERLESEVARLRAAAGEAPEGESTGRRVLVRSARPVVDDLDARARKACSAIQPRTWREFRAAGLLWWMNRSLHAFGWSIVVEASDVDSIVDAYPARVAFRGFDAETEARGFRALSAWLGALAPLVEAETDADRLLDEPPEWVAREPVGGGR